MPRQFATTTLKELLHRNNLTDVWRLQHPAQHAFTWSGKNPVDNTPVLTRIDKFYITYALTNNTTKSDIKPYPHSDHELILLTLDLSHMKRGRGYWHFNNTLLNNAMFTTDITNFWTNWLTQKYTFNNQLEWWDKAKYHFNQIAIHHATQQRKVERHDHTKQEVETTYNRAFFNSSVCAYKSITRYLKVSKENHSYPEKSLIKYLALYSKLNLPKQIKFCTQ